MKNGAQKKCAVGCGKLATVRGMCDVCRRALSEYTGTSKEAAVVSKKGRKQAKQAVVEATEALQAQAVERAEQEEAEGTLGTYTDSPVSSAALCQESPDASVDDNAPANVTPNDDDTDDMPVNDDTDDMTVSSESANTVVPHIRNRRGAIGMLERFARDLKEYDWEHIGLDPNTMLGMSARCAMHASQIAKTRGQTRLLIKPGTSVQLRNEKQREKFARFGAAFTVEDVGDDKLITVKSVKGATLVFHVRDIEPIPSQVAA